jgi:fructose-1-phosphate kinase PfkB-like protein
LLREISRLKAPSLLIVSGSLPQGLPANFHVRMARAAFSLGVGVIADVPAPLISEFVPTKTARSHTPLLLIKPNQAELEGWTGRKLKTDAALIQAARGLLHHPGKPGASVLVCVSLAERGALLLSHRGVWMGVAPKIRAKGTVGAGDSLVGAMASRLARAGLGTPEALVSADPRILQDALAWGLAAGAATAQSQGTSLARPSEIRKLRAKTRVVMLRPVE